VEDAKAARLASDKADLDAKAQAATEEREYFDELRYYTVFTLLSH
jgi:hypothetical protein